MSSITYFEEEVPACVTGQHPTNEITNRIEFYVSSGSGEERLYLKHTDVEGKESCSVFDKDQAKRFLEAANTVMRLLE